MKMSCMIVISRIRLTRLDSQLNAGTTASSSSVCVPTYAFSSAPPAEDQWLADDLEHVVAGQQHERVDREQRDGDRSDRLTGNILRSQP